MRQIPSIVCVLFLGLILPASGDGLRDNDPTKVRQVPPAGVAVPDDVRQQLEQKLGKLNSAIATLSNSKRTAHLADVKIFHRAVHTVLDNNEFFSNKEFDHANELLDTGLARAIQLIQGKAPWASDTGLVVRGFQSRIDHTPQPYGLVIPEGDVSRPLRLDVWFHGRGERTSEVGFIHQRMHQVGRYAPANTIVLHPYGRYSNAFKFAGETDVLEAIEEVRKHYNIDPDKISVRGFSMGGAACWQFAVLYSDRWFAANPGAGFSETPEFLKFFQKETLNPTWYERKLWRWYDCNGYAMNLLQCPTIAYSGELDIQKQAADIMESALEEIDVDLVHIIGAKTKHTIDDASKIKIEKRMDELARFGRDRFPKTVNFRTYSLKYNRMHWVSVDAITQHWEPTTVQASLDGSTIKCSTENVEAMTFEFPAGSLSSIQQPVVIVIDGQEIASQRPMSDRSFRASLFKEDGKWTSGTSPTGLRKRHGLQGPIDDAFMDSFIFVEPTKTGSQSKVDAWVRSEFQHAVQHWRQQFRGDARVKASSDLKEDDIASSNLVVFGTPTSNPTIAKVLEKLPISWNDSELQVGKQTFDAQHHAPILIFPNPLNPNRYIVLNSGFTYREYAYLNNARQVPMLPDWAVVDVRTPVTSQYPGKVVAADFFDEQWRVKTNPTQGANR